MDNFENQLDEIRIKMFEDTKNMDKIEMMNMINEHARQIAKEYGIRMIKEPVPIFSKEVV
jgi:hypothetical protein